VRALAIVACLLAGCVAPKPAAAPVIIMPNGAVTASVRLRVDAWTKLSTATDGKAVESKTAADVPVLIRQIFDEGVPTGPVDVVFVVDTTGSMSDDIDAVKADMRQILAHLRDRNPDYRVGVVAYRDITDEYLTRTFLTLTDDDVDIEAAISSIEVYGGEDWREHVYAGINTALDHQPWRPDVSQHIILMGDAPPHDDYDNDPRNYESVTAKARTAPLRVRIHTIGIKCDASCEEALTEEAESRAKQSRLRP
jgi:Mg-chelatase subunit ChlD